MEDAQPWTPASLPMRAESQGGSAALVGSADGASGEPAHVVLAPPVVGTDDGSSMTAPAVLEPHSMKASAATAASAEAAAEASDAGTIVPDDIGAMSEEDVEAPPHVKPDIGASAAADLGPGSEKEPQHTTPGVVGVLSPKEELNRKSEALGDVDDAVVQAVATDDIKGELQLGGPGVDTPAPKAEVGVNRQRDSPARSQTSLPSRRSATPARTEQTIHTAAATMAPTEVDPEARKRNEVRRDGAGGLTAEALAEHHRVLPPIGGQKADVVGDGRSVAGRSVIAASAVPPSVVAPSAIARSVVAPTVRTFRTHVTGEGEGQDSATLTAAALAAHAAVQRPIGGDTAGLSVMEAKSVAGKSIAAPSDHTFRTHMTGRELLVGASVMRELMRSVSPISTPGVQVKRKRRRSPRVVDASEQRQSGSRSPKRKKKKKDKKEKAAKREKERARIPRPATVSESHWRPMSPTPPFSRGADPSATPLHGGQETSAAPSHYKPADDASPTPLGTKVTRPVERWAPSPCSSMSRAQPDPVKVKLKKRKGRNQEAVEIEDRERARSPAPKLRPRGGKEKGDGKRRKRSVSRRKRKRSP